MSKFIKIKQASEQTGVHLETIRYYEKQGLIAPIHQQNGYRVFDEQTLAQLCFIKACRNIGFSLKDIKVLLAFQKKPNHQCDGVDELTRRHLSYINEQIKQLQGVKSFLEQIIGCRNEKIENCQIIQSIKDKE
ncbi:MerR family transcriptional regulator [Actinobacillus capsulatus]|uniref:MerR family transcriptional regulator n=1 Tax=Actinobacillus capsulatus TaxID=717 RepID=UPI00037C011C|nr:MerR family transcriptional regulator [Actinobacillus capsulatus]